MTPAAPGPSSASLPTSMPAQGSHGALPAMGGLAGPSSHSGMNATTLGVPPPPLQLLPRTITGSKVEPKPASPPARSKVWLVLALLLVAGGAAALVLVLLNR